MRFLICYSHFCAFLLRLFLSYDVRTFRKYEILHFYVFKEVSNIQYLNSFVAIDKFTP